MMDDFRDKATSLVEMIKPRRDALATSLDTFDELARTAALVAYKRIGLESGDLEARAATMKISADQVVAAATHMEELIGNLVGIAEELRDLAIRAAS